MRLLCLPPQLRHLRAGLEPLERGTTVCLDSGDYTFTVRALDRSGNVSSSSNAVG